MQIQIQTLRAASLIAGDVDGVFEVTMRFVVTAGLSSNEIHEMTPDGLRSVLASQVEEIIPQISLPDAIDSATLLEVRRDFGELIELQMLSLHQCQNCDSVWDDDEIHDIRDLTQRVSPGEPYPSGQCPDCGSLCQAIVAQADTPFEHSLVLSGATIDGVEDPSITIDARIGDDVGALVADTYGIAKQVNEKEISVDFETRRFKR